MQLFIPISSVDTNNVYFTEKRKNVILEGNFVKIIYSTEHFEMNGLHLLLQIYSVANYHVHSLLSLDEQLRALKTALPDSSRTMRTENHSSSCSPGSDETDAQRLGRSYSASRLVASLGVKDERANFPATFSSRSCEPPVKCIEPPVKCIEPSVKCIEPPVKCIEPPVKCIEPPVKCIEPPVKCIEPPVKCIEPPVKFIEHFDPNFTKNAKQIELLCDIERRIVTNYIEMKAPLKTAAYNLKHQLDSGYFRFARECPASQNNSKMNCVETPGLSFSTYALKISGIWETNSSVGITVKFVKL